jgi:hypothetical protein
MIRWPPPTQLETGSPISRKVGTVTTAQLSATSGQIRATPFQRPAKAIFTPMMNMPSMDSGQKASRTASQRSSRKAGTAPCSTVHSVARVSSTYSTLSIPRAIREVPVAAVRSCAVTRPKRPSWKGSAPRSEMVMPKLSAGLEPTAKTAADQISAPAVR